MIGCTTPQAMNTNFAIRKQATMAGVDMQHSRLIVTIVREGLKSEDRAVQKMPGTYDNVDLTLSNTNSLLTANKTSADIALASPATQKTTVFSALRPGSGYKLAAVLQDGAGTVGSGYADGITLIAGQTKVVTIVISVNGDITVSTNGGGNGNTIGDATEWFVVKGDTVTLNTGFNNAEAGVDKMEVYINGELYATANKKIDEKTSSFASYTFASGTDIAGFTYVADDLTPSTGNTVTFRLKDADGNTIGESVLNPLTVLDPAAITLQLQ